NSGAALQLDYASTTNINGVILNGGSLTGAGSIGNVTGTNGTVSPGVNSTTPTHGIITVNGTSPWGASSTFFVDLGNVSRAHPNPIAGADYDQLVVNNGSAALDLGNTLLRGSSGAGAMVGDSFTILQAGGSISGFFRGDLTGAGSIGQVTDHVFI